MDKWHQSVPTDEMKGVHKRRKIQRVRRDDDANTTRRKVRDPRRRAAR